jgi:hypothetical protein
MANRTFTELYTDESPGLKVDPVVVLVLSVGFIISVVALHSMLDSSLLLLDDLTCTQLSPRSREKCHRKRVTRRKLEA